MSENRKPRLIGINHVAIEVGDIDAALERVKALGGTVVHPGSQWAICKDSEGSPFGLARRGDVDPSVVR